MEFGTGFVDEEIRRPTQPLAEAIYPTAGPVNALTAEVLEQHNAMVQESLAFEEGKLEQRINCWFQPPAAELHFSLNLKAACSKMDFYWGKLKDCPIYAAAVVFSPEKGGLLWFKNLGSTFTLSTDQVAFRPEYTEAEIERIKAEVTQLWNTEYKDLPNPFPDVELPHQHQSIH